MPEQNILTHKVTIYKLRNHISYFYGKSRNLSNLVVIQCGIVTPLTSLEARNVLFIMLNFFSNPKKYM